MGEEEEKFSISSWVGVGKSGGNAGQEKLGYLESGSTS